MSVQIVSADESGLDHEEFNLKNSDEDEDLEETLGERLWGLTEMFPDWFRNVSAATTYGSIYGAKTLYKFSRELMWIIFSSSAILMAPVIFEVERAQMEDMQRQQNRQILLGPNAAIAGQSNFSAPPPIRS